jgi:hypothetical protein
MNTHLPTALQNTFTPTTLQIPAKLLLCIREFAARSDIRYYLNTLHFSTRAGRAYISATDGHMGGIIRSDEGSVQGPDINWLVPIELFDKLSKSHLTITFSPPMLQGQVLSAMPEAEESDVSVDGKANITASWRCEVQLQQDAQTRSITSLEAGTRFPDMGRLFPQETGGCAAPIDSALLTRIYKAYTALKRGDGLSSKRGGAKLGNGASAHPVFGYPTQPDSVVLLDFRDLDFTGLVMPLRGQGKANTADWLWEYGQTQEQRPLDQVSDAYRTAAKARRKQQIQAERAEVRIKLEAHAQRRRQAFKDAQLAEAAAPAKTPTSSAILPAAVIPTSALSSGVGADAAVDTGGSFNLPSRFVVPQAWLQAQGVGAGA